MTEAQESERRNEEVAAATEVFMEHLNVDDVIAHLLVTEGFTNIEAVAFVPMEELAEIEGFDETLSSELRERAQKYLVDRDAEMTAKGKDLGVTEAVSALDGLRPAMIVPLGENNIKTLDDLADLASDELREIIGEVNLTADEANDIIMAARAHWFEDDKVSVTPENPEENK